MTWKTLSDRMLRTTLATFGEQVVYVRDGVQTVIRNAVFDENFQSVDQSTGAPVISDSPMLGLAMADIPGGKWQDGDKVLVRGVTYLCIEPQKDSEFGGKMILHRQP